MPDIAGPFFTERVNSRYDGDFIHSKPRRWDRESAEWRGHHDSRSMKRPRCASNLTICAPKVSMCNSLN